MNDKAKELFNNIRYTVTANFLILGISIMLNLIVPKFLGIKEYSFWQLYIFYSSYIGFFHFGWLDGIYLKIAGKDYNELDKRDLGSQFWYFFIFESLLSFLFIGYNFFFLYPGDKAFIWYCIAFLLVINNCKNFVLYIMQSTNRIKEYAQLSRTDRYIYVMFLSIYLFFGGKDFKVLICIDIFSRLIMTVWGGYRLRDMLYAKPLIIRKVFPEIIDNIKVGSNLMISNLANLLIIGSARIFVEKQWNIETFGKLSFTLSISNMFMTFINAVGVVIFPLLRRTEPSNLSNLYKQLRKLFVPITFTILVFFYPMKIVLSLWLPAYNESLIFMGVLFPIVVYEGRMSLLVNTFLKTIREEKKILISNIFALVTAIICSVISVFIVKSLLLTVLTIMFSLFFRCIFAEQLLTRNLKIDLRSSYLQESLLTCTFIFGNLFFDVGLSFMIYLISFFIYLMANLGSMKVAMKDLVVLVKKEK